MAEEIYDTSFYREDFSVNSKWEAFNAQLMDVLQKWQVNNADWGREFQEYELYSCAWHVQQEAIKLLNQRIVLRYFMAQLPQTENAVATGTEQQQQLPHIFRDLLSLRNNFGPAFDGASSYQPLHPLARLYGLRRFIILQQEMHSINSPTEINFFKSSIAVVCAEIKSSVPIFVQIHDAKFNMFAGFITPPIELRVRFDLVALEHAPMELCYLSGLLEMFKSKFRQQQQRSILISMRTVHTLNISRVRIPMSVPFAMKPLMEDEADGTGSPVCHISSTQFVALPYGFSPDSRTELYVYYTWPAITEHMCIDRPSYSDFVPGNAPLAHLNQLVVAMPYLTQCLRDFIKLCGAAQAIDAFVGRSYWGTSAATFADVSDPFDMQSTYQVRSYSTQLMPGPMKENEINQMMYYLFPDVHPDASLFPYAALQGNKKDPHRIKSSEADSFVCRLACLLATCNSHFGGKSGLAQLWATVLRELRSLFEVNVMVGGVTTALPNAHSCILNQKLQMLNVCAQRRDNWQKGVGTSLPYMQNDDEIDMEADEDAEFYSNDEDDVWTDDPSKPFGRRSRYKNLLLINCDEYLYVPKLQETVPKTEDQVLKDTEMMIKLGADSGISTELMSPSLRSDMEAFKAANPKAKFEDFIRWYSPKDWEKDDAAADERFGHLSTRMSDPNNTWQTVWREAQSVPACNQVQLFNEFDEGSNVLTYLETRTIGDIYELTIVPVLHSALLKLMNIFDSANVLDVFIETLNELFADLSRYSVDMEIQSSSCSVNDVTIHHSNPEFLIDKIEKLEKQFYQYKCLEHLLGYPTYTTLQEVKRQFVELLQNNGNLSLKRTEQMDADSAAAAGEPQQQETVVNSSLVTLLQQANMRENMLSKDYVLRLEGSTNLITADDVPPQFMRAIVTGDKLRLCSAFTESTNFM